MARVDRSGNYHPVKLIRKQRVDRTVIQRAPLTVNFPSASVFVSLKRKDFEDFCKFGGIEIKNQDGTRVVLQVLDYEPKEESTA